jgi:prepilin-type N-terminal cleavage/methylation domain-containing protein
MLRSADQRGFTLVELAVAMSLLLLVSGALLAALESGTAAERHASTRIDDEQSVQLVLAQFSRDARNATAMAFPNPAPPSPPPPWPPDEVDLTEPSGAVAWVYEPATGVLQRELDGVAGISIGGLTNLPGTVFEFSSLDSGNLLVDSSATQSDVATCAMTVVASVTSQAHPPSRPFTETVSAPLRALETDRRGCP